MNSIDPAPGFGLSERILLTYLPEFAAGPSARMGPQGVRQLAQLGIYRARSYGLTDDHSLQLYAGLMMQLGVAFDEDPFHPWAHTALRNTPSAAYPIAEHQRVRSLYGASTEYFQRVLGKDSEHLRNALFRATQLRLDSLPSGGAGFVERMRRLLLDLYPQRMESAATDALEQTAAFLQGYSNKPTTGKSLAVQVAVSFAMGRGAFQDPRFPQLREVSGSPEKLFLGLQNHLQQELRDRGWK
ncbi:hypothetical protein [Corallococcus exiguus]|uniref:hypothetical protein n=1 Tax=Corallococcus exiguus TaxID=83462 RepID=UPI00155FEB2E|nr:hypothetical protein [Corallococcus exiguus]NRD54830.1 hypothetical protein [Corallococcus exiguus]